MDPKWRKWLGKSGLNTARSPNPGGDLLASHATVGPKIIDEDATHDATDDATATSLMVMMMMTTKTTTTTTTMMMMMQYLQVSVSDCILTA